MENYQADRLITINVDVQNDFCPGGALAVPDGDQVIPPLNALNAYTRQLGGLVVATGDQHPAQTPHFDKWPVHCVAGTPGAELHPALDIREGDIILDKGMGQADGYSAFEGIALDGRRLEEIVWPRGREKVAVIVGGLATDYCVLNTVVDGARFVKPVNDQVKFFVARDAIQAVNLKPGDGNKAVWKMAEAGAKMVESADILDGKVIELR